MFERRVRYQSLHLDPETRDGQALLAEAYAERVRVVCLCRRTAPELYIARHGERYLAKRLPGTGHLHAPGCVSFEPPEELSGMAHIRKAIRVDETSDTAHLTLAFPLTQSGKRMAPPPMAGSPQTEVNDKPGKLTLLALMQLLWHEAGLTTWVPAMAGKRSWYIVRREILKAARQMEAKGFRLADRLFVPEPFSLQHKEEISARHGEFLNRFTPIPGQPKALGILIAPLKAHTATAYGGKLTFTHLPEMPVFVSGEMYARICEKFAGRLILADQLEGAKPILAGLMGYSESGYPQLHEAALMVVTPEWLPVESARDAQVIAALVEQKRRFQRQLRFTLKADAPIATAVLTDTAQPHALFATPPQDVTDSAGRMAQAAEEGVYQSWLWDHAGPPPVFPAREAIRESVKEGPR